MQCATENYFKPNTKLLQAQYVLDAEGDHVRIVFQAAARNMVLPLDPCRTANTCVQWRRFRASMSACFSSSPESFLRQFTKVRTIYQTVLQLGARNAEQKLEFELRCLQLKRQNYFVYEIVYALGVV